MSVKPSRRKSVNTIEDDSSPLVANYPKESLYGLTLTKPLRQFHDLQRNIHRLFATTFVLVIEPFFLEPHVQMSVLQPCTIADRKGADAEGRLGKGGILWNASGENLMKLLSSVCLIW